jgi:hypothetical protein
MTRTELAQHAARLRSEMDQIHPGMLLLVVPLLLAVVGAVIVAFAAVLAATFIAANCAGVVIVARRAVHWAATYERTNEAEAVTS